MEIAGNVHNSLFTARGSIERAECQALVTWSITGYMFFRRWKKVTSCLRKNSGEVNIRNTTTSIFMRFVSCVKGYCSVLSNTRRWDKGILSRFYFVYGENHERSRPNVLYQ